MKKSEVNFEKLKGELKRCPRCGVPLKVSKGRKWNSNGTITQVLNLGLSNLSLTNTFFIEKEDNQNFFEKMRQKMGAPSIQRIYEGAKIHACETIYQCIPWGSRTLLKAILNFSSLRKGLFDKLTDNFSIYGFGIYKPIQYIPRRKMVVVAEQSSIFNPNLVAGDIVCLFYSIERIKGAKRGISVSVDWEKKNSKVLFTAKYQTEEKGVQEYLPSREIKFLPGNKKFSHCPICGVPKIVGEYYEWVDDKWWIIEKNTGKRIHAQCFETMNRVVDAFAKEFGVQIYSLALEIEKEYRKKYFSQHPDYQNLQNDSNTYRQKLEIFPLRGMGNPVKVEKQGRNLLVRIDNVYSSPLAAGWMAALYEYIEGEEAEVQYTSNLEAGQKGFAIFKVFPK